MTNFLINLKIELKNYQTKYYYEWVKNNSFSLTKLKLERQSIQCFLAKRDEKNKYTISGKERKDVNG